jgi:hypothetical protein
VCWFIHHNISSNWHIEKHAVSALQSTGYHGKDWRQEKATFPLPCFRAESQTGMAQTKKGIKHKLYPSNQHEHIMLSDLEKTPGECPKLTCPRMTAICLWNWPLSKPGSFCKRRPEGGEICVNASPHPFSPPT